MKVEDQKIIEALNILLSLTINKIKQINSLLRRSKKLTYLDQNYKFTYKYGMLAQRYFSVTSDTLTFDLPYIYNILEINSNICGKIKYEYSEFVKKHQVDPDSIDLFKKIIKDIIKINKLTKALLKNIEKSDSWKTGKKSLTYGNYRHIDYKEINQSTKNSEK